MAMLSGACALLSLVPAGAAPALPVHPADSAKPYYLFCYFRNEHQGMCYALSRDGYAWKPLHAGRPYLLPEVGPDKLMRDPSINLGPDGIYRVVWTTGWHDSFVGYAWSRDLIHWSPERLIPVMAGVKGTLHCWAPEIFYDAATGRYMLFWSSAVDTTWSVYYATTRDFRNFSGPKILFSNGGSGGGKAGDQGPIDAFIYRDTHRFILFYKKDDNTGVPNLYYRFGKTATGPWGRERGPVTPSTGDEGPSCIKVGHQYRVYTDPLKDSHAFLYVSTDLKKWKHVPTNLRMSHGTVLKISARAAGMLMHAALLTSDDSQKNNLQP